MWKGSQDFLHTFSMAWYHKLDIENGFVFVLQFFSLIWESSCCDLAMDESICTFLFFNFLGATLSLWLCWRSQIWTLSNPGVDAAETLFWFLWLVARGGCPKSGWTSGYRAGMPSQKFRSHTRMFCFTAQLLFPPVLFCLSWHWLVFWIQRVSFDVVWNQLLFGTFRQFRRTSCVNLFP